MNHNVQKGINVYFGKNVTIGNNCILGNNVTVYDNTVIGDDVRILDGAVLGRPPVATKSISRIIKADKPLTIGSGCVIGANAVLYCATTIGNNVLIGDLCSIREECAIGDNTVISRCVTINYHTSVGKNTRVMDNTHLTGNMIVGDNCFISVCVSSANDNNSFRPNAEYEYTNEMKGPVLENNVSVGEGAILLPGITVRSGSLVGAGAVVTKDVPENKVVMGIPAKVRE